MAPTRRYPVDSTTPGPRAVDPLGPGSGGRIVSQPAAAVAPPAYSVEVLADSPAGYWRLNDTSGTTAVDSSGNGHDGTYVGGVTLGQAGPLADGTVAPSFDGVDDRVDVADTAVLRLTGTFSLEVWVKTVDRSNYYWPVSKTLTNAPRPYEWRLESSTGLPTLLLTGTVAASAAPTIGVWAHLVVTFDSGTGAVAHYLNGSANGTGSASIIGADGGTPTRIGARDDLFSYFKGGIAEVAVYPSVLSPTRVAAHYTAGTTAAGGPVALDGTDAGTSATSGNLAVSHPLAGTTAGTSVTTGNLAVSHPLAATSTGTSTTAGDVAVAHSLATTTAGTSVTTGNVAVAHSLAGTSTGTSVTTGDVTVTAGGGPQALAGTSTGTSTTTGDLRVSHPLAGTSAGTSTTAGALGLLQPLAGTTAGTSVTTGNLRATFGLVTTSAGTSATTGNVVVSHPLAGTSTGTSTTTGSLAVSHPLAGTSAGTSTTTGDLRVTRPLAGTSSGTSATSGDLRVSHPLAGTSAGTSTTVGAFGLLQRLAGTSAGSSTDTGLIIFAVFLAGADAGSSTTAGTLKVSPPGQVWIDDRPGCYLTPGDHVAVEVPDDRPLAVLRLVDYVAVVAYFPGDGVVFTAVFQDGDGVDVDPTTVTFKLLDPSGAETTNTYPTGISKPSTGHYSRGPVTVTLPGRYVYRWESTGTGQAAQERSFGVEPTQL